MSLSGALSGGGGGGSSGGGTIAGTTGAADNRIIRSDGIGGSTVQSSGIAVDDQGSMSGQVLAVRALDDDYTLIASDSGSVFNIRSVGGSATITVIAVPANGFHFEVFVATNDQVTIDFVGSQVCYVGAVPTTAGGSITSVTKGSKIRIALEAPNLFSAIASGTWALA